ALPGLRQGVVQPRHGPVDVRPERRGHEGLAARGRGGEGSVGPRGHASQRGARGPSGGGRGRSTGGAAHDGRHRGAGAAPRHGQQRGAAAARGNPGSDAAAFAGRRADVRARRRRARAGHPRDLARARRRSRRRPHRSPQRAHDGDGPRAPREHPGPPASPGIAAITAVTRAFVAVRLDDDVRARLAAAVERLRPLAPGVAWVTHDNVHLTLKFLGGVETARLGDIERALGAAAAGHPAFDLDVHGLGAFPSRARPRVLWAGVSAGAAETTALAASVDAALAALGFARDGRAFAAHVTLGRVREPRANLRLAPALASGEEFGRQRVAHISLMRSELSPKGARYTELAAIPLPPG